MVVDIVDFGEVRWNGLALFHGRSADERGVLRVMRVNARRSIARGSRHAVRSKG